MSTTLLAEHETTEVLDRTLVTRPSLRDTLDQSLAMAWRALKKMRRNPEQWFDVTIQPLLFTAMFAYIFGGAISGSVEDYLPIVITGILAQTALTACMATGIQLREDMDKGVFDRFKSLPIARIAPLVGPAMADLLRYATAATLTILTGLADGLPARRRRSSACSPAGLLTIIAGWSLAWIFTYLGTRARSAQAVQGISMMIMFPLTFLSNAFVARRDPARAGCEAFVNVNPVSLVDHRDPRPDERRRRHRQRRLGAARLRGRRRRSSCRSRCGPTAARCDRQPAEARAPRSSARSSKRSRLTRQRSSASEVRDLVAELGAAGRSSSARTRSTSPGQRRLGHRQARRPGQARQLPVVAEPVGEHEQAYGARGALRVRCGRPAPTRRARTAPSRRPGSRGSPLAPSRMLRDLAAAGRAQALGASSRRPCRTWAATRRAPRRSSIHGSKPTAWPRGRGSVRGRQRRARRRGSRAGRPRSGPPPGPARAGRRAG